MELQAVVSGRTLNILPLVTARGPANSYILILEYSLARDLEIGVLAKISDSTAKQHILMQKKRK